MIKRKCPSCDANIINPLDFKRIEYYYCPLCGMPVAPNFYLSTFLSIALPIYMTYLYSVDLYYSGVFCFVLIIIRWALHNKIDALILPLQIAET